MIPTVMDRIKDFQYDRPVRGFNIDDIKDPNFDWLNYKLNALEYLAMIQNYLVDTKYNCVPIPSRQSVKLIRHQIVDENIEETDDQKYLNYINGGHANRRDIERGTFFYKPLFYGGYTEFCFEGHYSYNLLFYYGFHYISMVAVNKYNVKNFDIIQYMNGEYLFSLHQNVVFSICSNFYEDSCLNTKMFNDIYRHASMRIGTEPVWYKVLFNNFYDTYINTCKNASKPLTAVKRNTHILNPLNISKVNEQLKINEEIFKLSLTNPIERKIQVSQQWKKESNYRNSNNRNSNNRNRLRFKNK